MDLLYRICLKGIVEYDKKDRSYGGEYCFNEIDPTFRISVHVGVSIYQLVMLYLLKIPVIAAAASGRVSNRKVYVFGYVEPLETQWRWICASIVYLQEMRNKVILGEWVMLTCGISWGGVKWGSSEIPWKGSLNKSYFDVVISVGFIICVYLVYWSKGC